MELVISDSLRHALSSVASMDIYEIVDEHQDHRMREVEALGELLDGVNWECQFARATGGKLGRRLILTLAAKRVWEDRRQRMLKLGNDCQEECSQDKKKRATDHLKACDDSSDAFVAYVTEVILLDEAIRKNDGGAK